MGNFVSSFKIDEKTVKISAQPAKQLDEAEQIKQDFDYMRGAKALSGQLPDKKLEISGNTLASGNEPSKTFSLKGTTPDRTVMLEGQINLIEVGNRQYELDKPLKIEIKDGKIEKSSLKKIEALVEDGTVKGSVKGKFFEQKIKLHPLQSDAKAEPSLDKMEAAVRVAKNGDPALEQVAKLTADSQGTSASIPAKPSSKGSAIG